MLADPDLPKTDSVREPRTMEVEVIQYLMPDGKLSHTKTDLSEAFRPQYEYMRKRGWNFGAEVLTTGHVSVTIEDRHRGEDVEIRVIANGPGVQSAMEEMLAALSKKMERKRTGSAKQKEKA